MSVALVWAESADGWIGVDGDLPWDLPEDRAHFRRLTSGHPVVMGRATWESLPERFRPLPGRENVVLSRRPGLALEGSTVLRDVDEVLERFRSRDLWVIGGAQVYAAFLPVADRIELTEVDVRVTGDTRAPEVDATWRPAGQDPEDGWHVSGTGLRYRFRTYVR